MSDSGVTPQDVYRFVERKLQHQKRRWQELHRQAAGDAERIVRYIIEKYKRHPGCRDLFSVNR